MHNGQLVIGSMAFINQESDRAPLTASTVFNEIKVINEMVNLTSRPPPCTFHSIDDNKELKQLSWLWTIEYVHSLYLHLHHLMSTYTVYWTLHWIPFNTVISITFRIHSFPHTILSNFTSFLLTERRLFITSSHISSTFNLLTIMKSGLNVKIHADT